MNKVINVNPSLFTVSNNNKYKHNKTVRNQINKPPKPLISPNILNSFSYKRNKISIDLYYYRKKS